MVNVFPTYTLFRIFLDGMLTMMIVYALLSFWQERKAIYWQYAVYMTCMLITFRLDDSDYQRADYAPGANYWVATLESIAFILYIRFAILLINIPQNDPFSYRLLRYMMALLAGSVVIDTVLWLVGVSDVVRSNLYTVNRFVLAGLALVVVPRFFRLRQPVVAYFITGSFFFVLGCLIALIINFMPSLFTREPNHPLTYPVSYIQVGVVLETLCFTLGLSRLNGQTEADKRAVQAQLIEQLRENERKQQKLQSIRDDIARDLHDELGADLGGIGMLAQAARQQLATRPDEALDKLALISGSARRVVATMREIIWNLNSVHNTLQNVVARLEETARTLLSQQAIALHLELPAPHIDGTLPAEYRRDLFLLFKEALHNLIRHSAATHARIRLSVEPLPDNRALIRLSVQDNGRGFDPEAVGVGGNGLRSMQQRAVSLGGSLHIHSHRGEGTTLRFTGPVEGILFTETEAGQPLAEETKW
ncbi:MAG: sensor histidine kinase [Cytophagales bacterium]|nr:MAG: sensor histidine kinase [Cytophagales bacterium]